MCFSQTFHDMSVFCLDGNQLRGGVFAMCGFSVILLLLLVASVIMLYKKRNIRPLDFDTEIVHKNDKNIN